MELLAVPACRDFNTRYEIDAERLAGLRSLGTATDRIVIGQCSECDTALGYELHESGRCQGTV